ncbi:46529_t:CDS:1, partial [Gigaspora margarita]
IVITKHQVMITNRIEIVLSLQFPTKNANQFLNSLENSYFKLNKNNFTNTEKDY